MCCNLILCPFLRHSNLSFLRGHSHDLTHHLPQKTPVPPSVKRQGESFPRSVADLPLTPTQPEALRVILAPCGFPRHREQPHAPLSHTRTELRKPRRGNYRQLTRCRVTRPRRCPTRPHAERCRPGPVLLLTPSPAPDRS